jgi:hypothetical protein
MKPMDNTKAISKEIREHFGLGRLDVVLPPTPIDYEDEYSMKLNGNFYLLEVMHQSKAYRLMCDVSHYEHIENEYIYASYADYEGYTKMGEYFFRLM